jgi:hypothetical protein
VSCSVLTIVSIEARPPPSQRQVALYRLEQPTRKGRNRADTGH